LAIDYGSVPARDAFFLTKKSVPVACPVPAGPISDSHTHLTSLRTLRPEQAIARDAVAGVDFIVTVVDPTDDARDPQALLADLADWQAGARELLDRWGLERIQVPRIRLLVGCHPHNARLFDRAAHEAMRVLLGSPLCAGVGEIGLDYHYDLSPRSTQLEVFEEQMRLAIELDAPVSLHIREAHADAADLLGRVGVSRAGTVLHCFDVDLPTLRTFRDMGCRFGIGGAVTFDAMEPMRAAVASPECPAELLLTETDSPYMAPKPLRGTPCEPAYIAITADFLAGLRAEALGEDRAALYATFAQGARDIFDARAGFDVPVSFGEKAQPDAAPTPCGECDGRTGSSDEHAATGGQA
jgi:TatD DNase family protein